MQFEPSLVSVDCHTHTMSIIPYKALTHSASSIVWAGNVSFWHSQSVMGEIEHIVGQHMPVDSLWCYVYVQHQLDATFKSI